MPATIALPSMASGGQPSVPAMTVAASGSRRLMVRTSAALPARSTQYAALAEGADPGRLPLLTLPLAIQAGLEQNPDLIALRQSEGVSQAIAGVARAFPFNPFFQFQATPVEQAPAAAKAQEKNAAQKIYQYYLVMQTFELAHQRQHRTSVAEAQLRSVRWNIYQAELQNIALTEQLFFTALYQRGLRDLAQASADLSGQLHTITQRRLEAGEATASDVATVRIDARAGRQQARLAEANYRTALLALRRQLNLRLDAPFEPVGDLAGWDWLPIDGEQLNRYPALSTVIGRGETLDGVVRELAAGRPDVMAARWTATAAQANVQLARAARVPNLIIGPYYQSDDFGIKYFGFRGQVDVPIANSGKPLVRQRAAELRLQQAVAQQLRVRAEQEVRAALDRYERARLLAYDSATDLGEGLPVELARLERQFQAGEVDVMRVVTARTSLLQLRRAYLDSLNELASAAAVVTAATGLPPDALVRPASEPIPPPLPPLPAPTDSH
jgi:outer membrane protein, heavy metal efflux system